MIRLVTLIPAFILAGCAVASGDIGKTISEKIQTNFGTAKHSISIIETDPLNRKVSKDEAYAIFLGESSKFMGSAIGGGKYRWTDDGRTAVSAVAEINQGINYDRYLTTFPVEYAMKNGAHVFTLSCPAEATYEWRDFSLTGRLRVSGDIILGTFKQYCTDFKFTVERYHTVEGEVNVDFEDKAVLANFRRLLKPAGERYRSVYDNSSNRPTNIDIEKAEKFEFDQKYANTVLSIVVYPYRKGSKVKYAFGVPYSLTSTGKTTFDPSLVSNIKKRIQDIAQD